MALNNTYVKIEREFDEEGNIAAERYYGADGAMIPCKDGYDEVHISADGTETYYLNGEEYSVPEDTATEGETEEDKNQDDESSEKEDAA